MLKFKLAVMGLIAAVTIHGSIALPSPAAVEAKGCQEWGQGEASEPHQQIGFIVREIAPLAEHIHDVQEEKCG